MDSNEPGFLRVWNYSSCFNKKPFFSKCIILHQLQSDDNVSKCKVRFIFLFFFFFPGGGEWSHEAGPQPGREAGWAGAHVHQHQQRPVHPQRGVHARCQGWQLLRVPAKTVDPGRQDRGHVIYIYIDFFFFFPQILVKLYKNLQCCCCSVVTVLLFGSGISRYGGVRVSQPSPVIYLWNVFYECAIFFPGLFKGCWRTIFRPSTGWKSIWWGRRDPADWPLLGSCPITTSTQRW